MAATNSIIQLTAAGGLAARRGQARFTTDDINFQMRNDAGRLARLRNHMQWKQIRKRAKLKDDEAADDLGLDDVDDIIENEAGDDDAEPPEAAELNSGPSTARSMFPHAADIPFLAALDNDDGIGGEDPNLSSGSSINPWVLARLVKNDERTQTMTAEEYNAWSECRSASFTYRKKKTFREWCGLGVIADHRAKDDVVEILGFLISEWVQALTERALEIQRQETRDMESTGRIGSKRKFDGGPFTLRHDKGWYPDRGTSQELEARSPIQARHVRQAFDILQTPLKRYTIMLNGSQSKQRKKMRIF